MTKPVEGSPLPHATPQWIRGHSLRRFDREGVLLLRSLNSRLTKDLPSDLQKLKCKSPPLPFRFSKGSDEIVNNERKQRPELLTAKSKMTYHERKLAGLYPLNALEAA
nr:hypothetical protein CFP56_59381 [Quercus suber]